MPDPAPPPGAGSAGGRFRPLLRSRSFRAFFLSFAAGEAGYSVYAVAVIWLALAISGSPAFTGLVVGVEFGIYALSFAVAPFVDRVRNLRTILIIGYPLQGAIALAIGLLARSGQLTPSLLLLLVIAISLIWDFTWTALNATLPRIVPSDQLFAANGLSGAFSGGNQIAGFTVGAALLLVVGPATGMLVYGALNFTGAVLALPLRAIRVPGPPRGFIAELREGWTYLRSVRAPPLATVVAFSAGQGFLSGAAPILLATVADRGFPSPLTAYAVLFTAFAVGGVAGSLLLGVVDPRRSVGRILLAACAAEGILLLGGILVAPMLGLSVGLWLLAGLTDAVFYTTVLVLVQATTPGDLVGRTLGNTYLFRGTTRAIGAAAIGVAAVGLSLAAVGDLLAGAFVGFAALSAVAAPGLRRAGF